MKKGWFLLASALLFAAANNVNAQFALPEISQKHITATNLSAQPLAFTENRGQWGNKTLFKADAGGATFYFCRDEVAYLFVRDTDELEESPIDPLWAGHGMPDDMLPGFDRPRYKKEALIIRAQFVDANPNPEIVGEDRLPHNCNYFYGNDPTKWRTDVPNYSAITYKDIWPGIDLKYHGNGEGMKYDFIVNPGADISQIRIRYEGVNELSISNSGDLQAQTRFGLIHENIPEIYQKRNGARESISGLYRLIEPGVFGFAAENYDPSVALVIDPELVYSTYLGGSLGEGGNAIVIDDIGAAYIAGWTQSHDFPMMGPYDGSHNGVDDIFLAKLSTMGNALEYCTYLGGNLYDHAKGIAIDLDGNAVIAGGTSSIDFPTANAYDESYNGGNWDAFVTKLSTEGNELIYSTFLGGNGTEQCLNLDIDELNNIYLIGWTMSADFPLVNPYDASIGGRRDAFAAKLSSDGDSLIWSTFLGGSANDYGYGIAPDRSGISYIAGITSSSDFPMVNAYDPCLSGGSDAFIAKLGVNCDSIYFSTFLGGASADGGMAIAVNDAGNAFVAGITYSPDFPLVNPIDSSYNGAYDAFIVKFASDGLTLAYSSLWGGSQDDVVREMDVNAYGEAYISGLTYSPDFPTVNAYQADQDSGDAFVTKISPSGTSIVYSTYLGGNDLDYCRGIAIDNLGNAYLTGFTCSDDFPLLNAYQVQQVYGDAFITKIGPSTDIKYQPEAKIPTDYSFSQNYPNPFNNTTVIYYNLPIDGHIRLKVFDILGRCVDVIVDERQQAGYHQVAWNAGANVSGVYFYSINAGDFVESKKMLLLK